MAVNSLLAKITLLKKPANWTHLTDKHFFWGKLLFRRTVLGSSRGPATSEICKELSVNRLSVNCLLIAGKCLLIVCKLLLIVC